MDRQPNQYPAILASCLLAAFLASGEVRAQSTPPAQRPPANDSPNTPPRPTKPDPARDPALSDPNLDDDASGKRRPSTSPVVPVSNPPSVPGTSPATKPTGAIPPTGSTGPSIPKGTLLPEGTFLSGRPGAIVKSPGGSYLFVPSEASAGMAKATPMVLQWNQRLSQVAAAIEGNDAAAASVSGQAFVYKGRQYLLLSVFSMTRNTDIVAPAPGNKSATPNAPAANADVRTLMEELDSRPSAPRAMDQRVLTTESTTVRGSKDTVIAEGTVITGRRARLVRGPGGLTVTFDNGPGNAGLPPMQLLPCRLLEQLESLAASRGENLTIRLSGRTTVHAGMNYLLPTMYQVIRPGDLRPIQ